MSEPFTWGDYFWLQVGLPAIVSVVIIAWFALGALLQRPECGSCGRPMQRRRKLHSPYSARWYCPFHDEEAPC